MVRRLIILMAILCVWGGVCLQVGATESNDKIYRVLAKTHLQNLLLNHKFSELHKKMKLFYDKRRVDPKGKSILVNAYYKFHITEDLIPHLNAWCETYPDSHFPFAVRGGLYTDYAWEGRSSGWAIDVSAEEIRSYHDRLRLALADLKRAHELEPFDSFPPTRLLVVCRALNLPREHMERYFQPAIALAPKLYGPYSSKLEYLKPKWHGSVQEMFEFGQWCFDNTPEDSWIDGILIDAHHEMAWDLYMGPSWWHKATTWADIEKVFRRRLERDPENYRNLNGFDYYALKAGKYSVARNQFQAIGSSWDMGYWNNLLEKYLEACQTAFTTGVPADQRIDVTKWFLDDCEWKIRNRPNPAFYYFTRGYSYRLTHQMPSPIG